MTNQRTIAKRLGISQITVSRVISGYEHVKPELREKVLAEIERTSYRLNENARNLITGKTGRICVVAPDLSFWQSSPFFTYVFRGICEAAQSCHHNITISSIDDVMSSSADAYIGLNFGNIGQTLVAVLNKLPRPSVIVQSYEGGNYNYIGLDNEHGGRLAAQHLLELGHIKFLFIGQRETRDSAARHKGFAQGIGRRRKIDIVDCAPEFQADSTVSYVLEKRISAVFAWSDLSALQFLHACGRRGVRVPEEVSVVGFDDFRPLSTAFSPTLTTVRQPLYEMGKETVRLLLSSDQMESQQTIVFKPELIIRESTSTARG